MSEFPQQLPHGEQFTLQRMATAGQVLGPQATGLAAVQDKARTDGLKDWAGILHELPDDELGGLIQELRGVSANAPTTVTQNLLKRLGKDENGLVSSSEVTAHGLIDLENAVASDKSTLSRYREETDEAALKRREITPWAQAEMFMTKITRSETLISSGPYGRNIGRQPQVKEALKELTDNPDRTTISDMLTWAKRTYETHAVKPLEDDVATTEALLRSLAEGTVPTVKQLVEAVPDNTGFIAQEIRATQQRQREANA